MKNVIIGLGVAAALVGGYLIAKSLSKKQQAIADLQADRERKLEEAKNKQQLRASYDKWSTKAKAEFGKEVGAAVQSLKGITF